MKKYMTTLLLIASVIMSVSAFRTMEKVKGKYPNPNKVDGKCVAEHCAWQMAKAMVDVEFIKEGVCEEGCNSLYYTDDTPMKLHYQNCTTKCALTYDSKAGEDFLGCTMEKGCVTFAPIPGICPKPEPGVNTQLSDLNGEWWQQYGHNPLWDCYNCQHIHEQKEVNDAEWCAQT